MPTLATASAATCRASALSKLPADTGGRRSDSPPAKAADRALHRTLVAIGSSAAVCPVLVAVKDYGSHRRLFPESSRTPTRQSSPMARMPSRLALPRFGG